MVGVFRIFTLPAGAMLEWRGVRARSKTFAFDEARQRKEEGRVRERKHIGNLPSEGMKGMDDSQLVCHTC